MYKLMYKRFYKKGLIRNLIFRCWYEIEWLRVEIKELIKTSGGQNNEN